VSRGEPREPVAPPPPQDFRVVKYDASVGQLEAYLSPNPRNSKKNPAIIWITGGDCNSIGDVWSPAPAKNDQTASAYRLAGIVMMFPSLRGGNQNPGSREGYLGEIDDVLAAHEYLAKHLYIEKEADREKQAYVDPDRIYLGGHSTGGTLVFQVAASTDKFRAVFSFGPAADVATYPADFTPFDRTNRREIDLRSPIHWTHAVRSPLFVFEGTQRGNIDALKALERASKNPLIHFYPVPGKDHFSVLAPLNQMLAQKILRDEGQKTNITITDADLQ
jgi:dipeptidyl aminopeptidase/acylaminoacyl peptidase